jgi:UPF0755 protein
MKKLLLWMIVIGVLVFGLRSCHYSRSLAAVDPSDTARQLIKVPAGSTASDIAALLEESDVIRSASVFRRYAATEGVDSKFKAGTFVLNRAMTVQEIATALTEGKTGEVVVTIPEGYTVKDLDALLAEKGLAQPGDTIRCAQTCDFSTFDFLPTNTDLADRGGKLEGYLFPDTYFATTDDFKVKFFLERLLGTFRQRVVTGLADDIKASGHTLHEVVIMASLIEEETRKNDERPMVSGILWKRFDIGMGLGVDAAVRYIVDKPSAAITVSDLDTDSPYNLRKFRGLPPGPIANPSIGSIEAALNPKASDYLYYLHGNDGQIRYATTNDEHNENRARYLQ